MSEPMTALFGLLMFVGLYVIYFIPSFVAYRRNHRQVSAIILTNFLFGWTFIGWGVALIWAVSATPVASASPQSTFVLRPQKYDSRPLSSLAE